MELSSDYHSISFTTATNVIGTDERIFETHPLMTGKSDGFHFFSIVDANR